jgi:hypothetical protein
LFSFFCFSVYRQEGSSVAWAKSLGVALKPKLPSPNLQSEKAGKAGGKFDGGLEFGYDYATEGGGFPT